MNDQVTQDAINDEQIIASFKKLSTFDRYGFGEIKSKLEKLFYAFLEIEKDKEEFIDVAIPEDEPAGQPTHIMGLKVNMSSAYLPLDTEEPPPEEPITEKTVVYRTFYIPSRRKLVIIERYALSGKVIRHCITDLTQEKIHIIKDTLKAASAWDIEAETKAMDKLQDMISPAAFKQYFCTGMFMELSKRSRVRYILRRCRPTLAYNSRRFLASLCVHSMGYYQGTWAGVLVPTDDVIAHLLYIRSDEHRFWKKSSQHSEYLPQAGF